MIFYVLYDKIKTPKSYKKKGNKQMKIGIDIGGSHVGIGLVDEFRKHTTEERKIYSRKNRKQKVK